MAPGSFVSDPIASISLGTCFNAWNCWITSYSYEFFTVGNAKEARKSVVYATGFVGYFYLLIVVVGLGGIVYLMDPNIKVSYLDAAGKLIGGNNMAAVHLAQATGGSIFLGFISAVAFATILKVVAGLAICCF